MRVFLTGVTGFLGSHAAEALLRAGHDVTALARSSSSLDPDLAPWLEDALGAGARLRLVRGSLADSRALEEGLRDAEAVVHVAGVIRARNEAEFLAVNRDGTTALVRAALARAVSSTSRATPGGLRRFVLVSSQAAGGPSRDGRPVTGADPPRPVSAYGRSKLAGETEARAIAAKVPLTILRPPVIFGPRDRMLRGFFRAVSKGLMVVWGDGTNRFSVSYAPDVARAAVLALEVDHPSGSIVYPSDERDFDWRGLVATLGSILGRRVRVIPLPGAVFAAAAAASTGAAFLTGRPPAFSLDKLTELREPFWLCSSEQARRLLGWRPSVPIVQALEATHAWYRARGLL